MTRAPDRVATGASARGQAAASASHALAIERVTHRFSALTALDDVSLDIRAGELVALLGPSGCGKSTLLRIVAGFLKQTAGRILVDGAPIDHLRANVRGTGIMFQNYALFPHMNVARNVAYGLEARRAGRTRTRARVTEMLALVRLEPLADRLPRHLSGGQQQRVALARALAVEPTILLLDEPFGALDKNLRLDMQIELKRLQRATGITSIVVTHDQEEALSMADRIAVMNRGAIEQFADPATVYDRPATLFVNQFVGTTNLLPGEIAAAGERVRVALAAGATLDGIPLGPLRTGESVLVAVRPEQLRLAAASGAARLEGTLRTIVPLGPTVVLDVELRDKRDVKLALQRESETPLPPTGATIFLEAKSAAACRVFSRPT